MNVMNIFFTISVVFFHINIGFSFPPNDLVKLRNLLDQPYDQIDFAKAKISIDQIISPANNDISSKIDTMVNTIKRMIGDNASSIEKLITIRKFLYQKGPWNNYLGFEYDFSDPQGTKLESKLLSRYIETRKGNCVSMPILLLILGQRLGLDISASVAPNHYFVKFRESETGRTYNIEATNGGGFTRDIWYQKQMHISDLALQKKTYLDSLDKRQALAIMATIVGEFYFEKNNI